MYVIKCDLCQKELKGPKEEVTVGWCSIMPKYSFCPKCGKPIIAFLQRHGFIKNKKAPKKSLS